MLFDRHGQRKYLTTGEWRAFLTAADSAEPSTRSFCWTLAYTGARISEVRALTPLSIDAANDAIVVECLKRRRRGIFRAVPVPHMLIALLDEVHDVITCQADPVRRNERLWPWCRTTAWARVKGVCAAAGVPEAVRMPKAFRHTFGIEGAAHVGVPLGTIKRWLGHARLESTLVYTDAVGAEERALAERMWSEHRNSRAPLVVHR